MHSYGKIQIQYTQSKKRVRLFPTLSPKIRLPDVQTAYIVDKEQQP